MFKSRFLRGLESQLIYYFYVLVSDLSRHQSSSQLLQVFFFLFIFLLSFQVAILILFFLDAIREMQKYSAEETQQKTVSHENLWRIQQIKINCSKDAQICTFQSIMHLFQYYQVLFRR